MIRRRIVVSAVAVTGIAGLFAGSALIDGSKSSSLVTNPLVTQATIGQTICVAGWTDTVRPTTSYTNDLKAKALAALPAESSHDPKDYEEDHFLPLGVGGHPTDPKNLVLEPWTEARTKDQLEVAVQRSVCAGLLTLAQGRDVFAHVRRWKP